jgi:hypothetical protein
VAVAAVDVQSGDVHAMIEGDRLRDVHVRAARARRAHPSHREGWDRDDERRDDDQNHTGDPRRSR